MTRFVLRHIHSFDRWSAVVLSFGLGYWVLRLCGDAGLVIAMCMIVAAAFFRAWMFDLGRVGRSN